MRIDATKVPIAPQSQQTKEISEGLERAFLTEMLKYAGPRAAEGTFSGGIGESQFGSMLTEAYAEALGAKLDLGLTVKNRSES